MKQNKHKHMICCHQISSDATALVLLTYVCSTGLGLVIIHKCGQDLMFTSYCHKKESRN